VYSEYVNVSVSQINAARSGDRAQASANMCTTVGNIAGNSTMRLFSVNDRLPIERQQVTWFPFTRQRSASARDVAPKNDERR
jgi:hypothetical protein